MELQEDSRSKCDCNTLHPTTTKLSEGQHAAHVGTQRQRSTCAKHTQSHVSTCSSTQHHTTSKWVSATQGKHARTSVRTRTTQHHHNSTHTQTPLHTKRAHNCMPTESKLAQHNIRGHSEHLVLNPRSAHHHDTTVSMQHKGNQRPVMPLTVAHKPYET